MDASSPLGVLLGALAGLLCCCGTAYLVAARCSSQRGRVSLGRLSLTFNRLERTALAPSPPGGATAPRAPTTTPTAAPARVAGELDGISAALAAPPETKAAVNAPAVAAVLAPGGSGAAKFAPARKGQGEVAPLQAGRLRSGSRED